jgi:hypothetical protein
MIAKAKSFEHHTTKEEKTHIVTKQWYMIRRKYK